MEQHLYNQSQFRDRRRILRANSTEAEKLLWRQLRNRRVNGLRFFRQYSVGPYILDFYCPQVRLAVEVDGGQHAEEENMLYDKGRSLYLEGLDIRTLRFWNNEVIKYTAVVMEAIQGEIGRIHNPLESPLP